MQDFIQSGLAVNLALERLARLWWRPLDSDRVRAFFVTALLECLPPTLRTLYDPELDPAELSLSVRSLSWAP